MAIIIDVGSDLRGRTLSAPSRIRPRMSASRRRSRRRSRRGSRAWRSTQARFNDATDAEENNLRAPSGPFRQDTALLDEPLVVEH